MVRKFAFSFKFPPEYSSYLIRAYSCFLRTGKVIDFPLVLQIQTQSLCNGRCSICPYSLVSKKLDQGKMSWNLFAKMANEAARAHSLSTVIFDLQNEPLLDKRIFEWIGYFKSINPDKYCTIVTNGESLDKFSAAEIVRSNLDCLVVSLNAHSKGMYESINNGLNFDTVMNNISTLMSNPSIKSRLILSFVHTKQNEPELRTATKYWKSQGVQVDVVELTNRAGSLKNYEGIKPKTNFQNIPVISRVWADLVTSVRKATGCEIPFYQMNILFNGDSIICCHDWNRDMIVGNVEMNSLGEVWNSEEMNEIRRLVLRKEYNQIDACQDCSFVK